MGKHVTDLIIRAGQAIDRLTLTRSKKLDVTPRQVAVLLVIADHEHVTAADVQRRTGIDKHTLSRVVNRLEAIQLIERKRHDDGRMLTITLTRKGKARIDRLRAIQDDVDRVVERALGERHAVVDDAMQDIIDVEEKAHGEA